MIDVDTNTAIDEHNGFDLLNPTVPMQKPKLKIGQWKFNYEYHAKFLKLHRLLLEDLKSTLLHYKGNISSKHLQKVDVVGIVHVQLEQLTAQEKLNQMGAEVL